MYLCREVEVVQCINSIAKMMKSWYAAFSQCTCAKCNNSLRNGLDGGLLQGILVTTEEDSKYQAAWKDIIKSEVHVITQNNT